MTHAAFSPSMKAAIVLEQADGTLMMFKIIPRQITVSMEPMYSLFPTGDYERNIELEGVLLNGIIYNGPMPDQPEIGEPQKAIDDGIVYAEVIDE